MKSTTLRIFTSMLASLILGVSTCVDAQGDNPPVPQAAAALTAEKLDQMLAPIALYPDRLVAQILMAATYPLEVVEADRWLQQPGNAALQGGQLTDALAPQPWDPSVKSLVPFPQVLKMLDDDIDWTERVGDAFLASQPAVMDSIQRLRQRAQAAGTLKSIPEESVSQDGQDIVIQPPNADTVYVPVYDPTVAYGAWPYPAYPPDYFPDDFYGAATGPYGFGWVSVAIVVPLWGWQHCDWQRHHIDLDRDRFAALNRHQPPPGIEWTHDPSHRHGVPYGDPGVRSRFAANAGVPNARVLHTPPAVAALPGVPHPREAQAPQATREQVPALPPAPHPPVAQARQVPHAYAPQAPRVPQALRVPHAQMPRSPQWHPAQMPQQRSQLMPQAGAVVVRIVPGFAPPGSAPGMQTAIVRGRVSGIAVSATRTSGSMGRPAMSTAVRTH